MMKRSLSLLLALIMVVGMLPNTVVFAADANDAIYIDESSSLEELEDLGIVDIPDDIPDMDGVSEEDIPDVDGIPEDDRSDVGGIPEDDPIFDEDAVSQEDHASNGKLPDAVTDHPETSPIPKEPDLEQMEEELPIIETPDPLPGDVDDSHGHQQIVSGSLSGTVTGDMTVSYVTRNTSLVWKANATGENVDPSNKPIDTQDGYPYYDDGGTAKDYTIQIVPDAEAAAAEGVTQLHINLYQIQIHGKVNLRIYLDPVEFAKYPNVTEVVIHSATPGRSLVLVDGSSLTLEGLPNCRLVLDGKQSDGSDTSNKLIQIGYGAGVGNVKIDYVTFRNAPESAILITGGMMESITISNCKFESTCINTVNDGGGAIYCATSYKRQEVVYPTFVEALTVSNCTFDGNKAARSGGAVGLFGVCDQVEIKNNIFTGTSVTGSSGRGGALGLTGFYNVVTLTGNTYTDCTASSANGGAIGICATIGKITVSDTFNGCRAKAGGAIFVTSDYLQSSNFSHMTDGANIYNRIGTLNINGSNFTDCSVTTGRGGAVDLAVQVSEVTVSNSSFTRCSTSGNGGGICFSYLDSLPEGVNWSSADWAAGTGLVLTEYSGAAFRDTVRDGKITTYGTVTVSNTTFDACEGAYGGGLYVQQSTSVVSFTATNVILRNCKSKSIGGGMALGSDAPNQRITLTNVTATNNQSSVSGAGVYIRARENNVVTIIDGEYAGNVANGTGSSNGGGGIHVDSAEATGVTVSISGATVKNNSTQSRGGGIYIYAINADSVSISNVTVRDNQSGVYGGGMYLYGTDSGSISISGSTLSNNESVSRGGGIYLIGRNAGSITFSHSTFGDNRSHSDGGGIYLNIAPHSTSLTNLWIYGNVAGFGGGTNYGDGGGIYLAGEKTNTVTLTNSVIGAKLRDTTNENGETVQEYVAAPNMAYDYIKETVTTLDTDGETPNTDAETPKLDDETPDLDDETPDLDDETPETDDETHETTKEYVGGGRGGGLAIMGVNLQMTGTKVLHNEADYTGGGIAIYSAGTLTVSNNGTVSSDISHNTAPRGGGMFVYGASLEADQYALEMTQGTVTHNRAYETALNDGMGGGIVIYNAKAKLTGVNISNNVCAQLVNEEYVFEAQGVANQYGGGLAVYFESTVEIYGCTIQGNQAQAGGGIVMHRGSTLTMKSDANGSGNQVKENISTTYGGGVYLRSRVNVNKDGQSVTLRNTFTVEDAVFNGNKAGTGDFGGNGGAICVMTGGVLEIINSEISYSEAQLGYEPQKDGDGNVIYKDGEPVWIVATTAEQNPEEYGKVPNAPKQIYGYGGGIACYGASATIWGCEIHHNTSGRRGGGVYGESGSSIKVYNMTAEDGTVTKSHIHHNETRDYGGGIGAVGHIVEKDEKKNNITVIDEQKSIRATLLLDGTLVEFNETKQQGGGGVYISSLAICDIVNQAVVQQNTAKSHAGGIMANIWGTVNVTDAQVIRNTTGGNGGGVYVSSHSEVVVTDGEINYNTAAGHGGGVLASGTAEWGGSSVTITGGEICYNTASGNGGGVYAIGSNLNYQEHSSTVLIKEGTMISNNQLTSENRDGGGVYVGQLSTVTIEGGMITENSASRYGGGVTGNDKATVTVAGGQIYKNYAGSAGGVYVAGESKVYVNDGLIKENLATAIWQESTMGALYGNGGGVWATDTAQIIIAGGEITDNEAKSCAYYTNEDGTQKSKEQTEICTVLTRDGGNGGGVYATGKAAVLLKGGFVTLNDARYGGGICSDDQASVTVQGGSVATNIASERGGGIYAGGASKVTMEPKEGDDTSFGSITGNTATLGGGGVYATGTARVTLSKGNIQSNTAKDGGGIYASGVEGGSSTVTVDGGMIGGFLENGTSVGNTANGGNGGGIYATSGAVVTVSGGQITGNHAVNANGEGGNGGGIYATVTSSVLVNGGNVKQNQAVNGAGICSNNQASVTVQGGSVETNIASERGGGIYAGGASTVTMEPKEDDDTSFGSITGNSATLEGGGIYATGSAEVTLSKGNIQSNTAKDGGGIYASGVEGGSSTVTVDGGMIGGFLENGTSVGNTANGGNGGGIYATSGAVVTVSGGQITGNHAVNVNGEGGNGGGIYATVTSSVLVNGGNVKQNQAVNGAGICSNNQASVTVQGGSVETNIASERGGGIYAGGASTVTMEPKEGDDTSFGTITGNSATLEGGGIYATGSARVTLSKGTIQSNTAKHGGGIYAGGVEGGHSKVTVDGGTIGGFLEDGTSVGNTANDGNGGGIYAISGAEVTVSGGQITGNHAVNVNGTGGNGGGIYATGYADDHGVDYGGAAVTVTGGTISSNTADQYGGGIYATDTSSTDSTRYTRVKLEGGRIESNDASYGAGIFADGKTAVTVQDGDIITNRATASGGGLFVQGSATVKIEGGSIGRLLEDGTKLGNTADSHGGGLFVQGSAKVTIEGGTISTNAAAGSGGGLFVQGTATVTMQPKQSTGTGSEEAAGSGGIVSYNTANRGAGMYISGAAQVTVSAGEIVYNTSLLNGGGVYLYTGKGEVSKLIVNGGKISHNTAQSDGGAGIYASAYNDADKDYTNQDGSYVEISNGEIKNNTATNGHGGGIVLAQRTILKITGGTISGNSTNQSGGGIYAGNYADITVEGGTISDNTAVTRGGGIYAASRTNITVEGGKINDNTAQDRGGGINGEGRANITVKGGEISGNKSSKFGGGVALTEYAQILVQGGKISDNTANQDGGGLYVITRSTATVEGGEISGNKATGDGGGIYVGSTTGEASVKIMKTVNQETGETTVGTVKENTADNGGGVFVLRGGKLEVAEGHIIYNQAVAPKTANLTTGKEAYTQLHGTGGGICVAGVENNEYLAHFKLTGTKDDTGKMNMSIYGNTATFSGDEVFSNGKSTKLEIPLVSEMKLDGYDLEIVGWFEDYNTGDTEYHTGLNRKGLTNSAADRAKVKRYRNSTATERTIIDDEYVNGSNLASGTQYVNLENAYVAMALGIPSAVNDTVVVDYHLKVDIDILSNDTLFGEKEDGTYGDGMNPKEYSLLGMELPEGIDGTKDILFGPKANSTGFERDLAKNALESGTVTWKTDNKKETGILTYEVNTMEMGTEEVFFYAAPGESNHYYAAVTVIPATTVYYEDNCDFITYHDKAKFEKLAPWTEVGSAVADSQDQDRPGVSAILNGLDADNIYGYDGQYATSTATYSNGTIRKVSVSRNEDGSTTAARATFTFTGTGFDIISLCSANTGVVSVSVWDKPVGDIVFEDDPETDDYEITTPIATYVVDTYYQNGTTTDLYQVPVIKADLTHVPVYDENWNWDGESYYGYGTYTVEIYVAPGWYPKDHSYNGCEFYLDAIRIYNPAGYNGGTNEDIADIYKKDGEAWPMYQELRDLFLSDKDLTSEAAMSGILFIDGSNTPSIKEYTSWGPNNEIYLNENQAVSFTLNAANYGGSVDKVHLAMRGLTGAGNVLVQTKESDAANAPLTKILSKQLPATDMYYDITGAMGKVLVIKNNGSAPIAISTLKVTHTKEPAVTNVLSDIVTTSLKDGLLALKIFNAEQLAEPTVTPKRPALSFNGMVCYNVFFTAQDLGDLTAADLGLAVFNTYAPDGTVENANEVHLGAEEIDGEYMIATDGVHAKYLGDTKYFRAFAKLADGSYVYSKMVSYSAVDYAKNILAKSSDVKLKQLVVAMLNYGAEAQKFFGYKTYDLMNKDLTADDLALLNGFDANSLNAVGKVDRSKIGVFAHTGGFSKRSPAISFKGAFEINYFMTPAYAVDGEMTMYFWNEDTYNSVTELTAENADKAVVMTLENGSYTASSDEIIAKYLDKTVYVAAVYESDGVTYSSGVLPYSIAAYCQKPPASVQELATAAAIYGCTAKQYFGV